MSVTSAQDPRHWDKYRALAAGDPNAAERGRLLAAHKIAEDPEARARVEAAIGPAAAAQMYPEAYRNTNGIFSGVARFLERIRQAVPW